MSIRDKTLDIFEKEEGELLIDELNKNYIECYWFFQPFLVNSGYLQLNNEELEDLISNTYKRLHTGIFNKVDVYGELVKELYEIILEFEKKLDE